MSILQEALQIVDERMATYGHPYDNVQTIREIWSAILGIEVSETQYVFCMIALKMGRELDRHHPDNMIDICGYMRVWEMTMEEVRRREDSTDTTDTGTEQVRA